MLYGEANIEKGEIVIRVPVEYLEKIVEVGGQAGFTPGGYKVVDPDTFAKDVCHALNDEDEDGTNAIHRLFDAAFEEAINQGSLGVEYDQKLDPDFEQIY